MKVSMETRKALEAGRVAFFVFFDFISFPMRVHSGDNAVQWDGQDWKGLGKIVEEGISSSVTTLSARRSNKGSLSASLPFDQHSELVINNAYYDGRKIELFVCALDHQGQVFQRVHYNKGIITKYQRLGDVLTFTAEDDTFDSIEERDNRHKRTVRAAKNQFNRTVRQQFRSDTKQTAISGGLVGGVAGFWEYIVAPFLSVMAMFFSSNWRQIKRRWQVRKRVYWFSTEPEIPGIRKRKRGYKVRADTLDEARSQLYKKVRDNIWDFPRGFVQLIVDVDRMPLELFNLDIARQQDDPERWEETDPIRNWGAAQSR